jgi:serine/threonine-protein kinase
MPDTVLAGRYRLDEPLGGTMAEVYLATDLELERRVVVKLLGRDAEHARFEREARAAAALASPNVVQLFDYGEVDGRPYMVLEHLPGGTLEERLTKGQPLADAETERIALDIATGLAHAHARGLVHRDLKPANILFDAEGRAKIADLGIARLGDSGTLTEAGTVLGTAAYISPEQAGGEPATPASDVYSFGVMLFRMLTGRLPFTSSSAVELVKLHRSEPAPAVTDYRPDAPARLESVATASLAKDPADRPQDGSALVAELGGAGPEAATTVLPVATAVMPRARPAQRRRIPPAVAGLALLVVLLGGVALALAVTHSGTTPSAPEITFSTPSATGTTAQTSTPVATTAPTTTASTTTQQPTTRPTTSAVTTTPATTAPPATTEPPPTTITTPPTTTTPPATTIPPPPEPTP